MNKKYTYWNTLFFIVVLIILQACKEDYVPKPRGYFRIDLPKHQYKLLDSVFPYTFEYPVYTQITPDFNNPDEKFWININYPDFNGTLYLSYKRITDDNLYEYMEDAHIMVNKHIPKASSINDEVVYQPEQYRYGLIYRIEGLGAASPFQFFITDSLKHFIRGALYFNFKPNNDSMAPVIDFIDRDLSHLINTLKWKPI